jgi:hypothetical protein
VDVHQVSCVATIGESPDLSADDLVKREYRAIWRVNWWPGEPFLEDVDLTVLAKLRI